MTTGKLVLTGITKSYGSRRVLDDVSFEAVSYTHLTLPTKA